MKSISSADQRWVQSRFRYRHRFHPHVPSLPSGVLVPTTSCSSHRSGFMRVVGRWTLLAAWSRSDVAIAAIRPTALSCKLDEEEPGWPRGTRSIAPWRFRRYGVAAVVVMESGGERSGFAALGGCREESGCGRRKNMFRWLWRTPVLPKNEFGGWEIEMAEGVLIWTPSATHLVGRVSPSVLMPF